MIMDIGNELEWQVKEKCGNRVVKVILERIKVSASGQIAYKSSETKTRPSLKIGPQNEARSYITLPSSDDDPGHMRPQRNNTKIYTQYFDGRDDSGDDYDVESDKSVSDSNPNDTSDGEFESLLLNKTNRKAKNLKKADSTCLNQGNKIHQNKTDSLIPKKLKQAKQEQKVACSVCNLDILKNYIKQHFKLKHPEEALPKALTYKLARISCDFCSLSFLKTYLWKHVQTRHPEQLSSKDLPREIKCDLCPLVLPQGQLFMHTKKQHSGDKVEIKTIPCLQCDLCSHKFMTQLGYESHVLAVHVVDKPFECSICFKSFMTEKVRKTHIKIAHEQRYFNCRYCSTKPLKGYASLKKHIETVHKGSCEQSDSETRGSNDMCSVCDTWFLTDSDVVKHLKKPNNKSVLKCEICSEYVYTPCRLNLHRKKLHTETWIAYASRKYNQLEGIVKFPDEKQGARSKKAIKISASVKTDVSRDKFSCVVCSALFSRRCDLDFHELKEQHRRWKCFICDKLYNAKKHLQIHIQTVHSDARPFHCTHEGCRFSFKVIRDLNKHMTTHDPDRILCKGCSKYISQKRFQDHVANSHEGKFTSDVCSKTWPTSKRLEQHLLTHTQERPFPCKFCDIMNKCERGANRHMKKCQDRSEDQRKYFAKQSKTSLRVAKKGKSEKRNIPFISNIKTGLTRQAVQLKKAPQPNAKSTSTIKSKCATTRLITQEVGPQYFGDNLPNFGDKTGPEGSLVKLEFLSKISLHNSRKRIMYSEVMIFFVYDRGLVSEGVLCLKLTV